MTESTLPANTSPRGESAKPLTLAEAKAEFGGQLTQVIGEIAPTLPSHITPERFQRVVTTAVNINPDLLRADRRSLFNACSRAAADGLTPDGRDGALVMFGKQAVWMPMVAGIIKKARQSGEIANFGARIVYENEISAGRFSHKVVDGIPKVDHDPILWGERGKPVLVYSFVQFKDGLTDFEFLHADDVAKIRAVSRSADKGPWKDWPDEMWKKSAIRRHAKRLPVSAELFDVISRDDETTEFGHQRDEAHQAILNRVSGSFGGDSEIIDQEVDETDFLDAEAMVARFIEGFAECATVDDADELLERGRLAIAEAEITDQQKTVLSTRLNAPHLARKIAIGKISTGKKTKEAAE